MASDVVSGTETIMLRLGGRTVLRSHIRRALPFVIAQRAARTRPQLNRQPRPTAGDGEHVDELRIKPLGDLDKALESLNDQEVTAVDVDPSIVLLENLNLSRPGTKTDKRYRKQKALLSTLTTEAEKTQSLFKFFLKEAYEEIVHYPNRDELEPLDDSKIKTKDIERGLEYEIKQRTLDHWNVGNVRYRRFEVLITVLENLYKAPDGCTILSVEDMAQCFEMAQYVADHELRLRARFLSGSLVYKLKRVEFDAINEYQYIESLMYYGNHHEAQTILAKNCEKIGQRWWYELMVINYIDLRNFNEAEAVVRLIETKYSPFMDERVYVHFINGYIVAGNVERVRYWTNKLQQVVEALGFRRFEREDPGLGAAEEDITEYLNIVDPPSRETFLGVISSYLGADDHGSLKSLKQETPKIMDFYLEQESTSPDDLKHLLLNFKFEYKTKIQPMVSKLSDSQAEKQINSFFDQYRKTHEVEAKQGDILDEFFNSLSQVGGFARIIDEFKALTEQQQRLTQRNMYRLLTALVNAGKLEQGLKVLDDLENSYRDVSITPDLVKDLVIPPVAPHHYIPFIRYYGRTGNVDQMIHIIDRFTDLLGHYNPLILTQILGSLDRNRQYQLAMKFIHSIVLEDIHKEDLEYSDFTKLYSAIWQCLRHVMATNSGRRHGIDLPDLRVLFMKMIHDNVVPSPDDYTTIIKTFTLEHDLCGLACVLQYMGLVHRCTPTPQCLKWIEKIYKDKASIEISELKRSSLYGDALKRLQSERLAQHSLDPFSPEREALEEQKIVEQMRESLKPDEQIKPLQNLEHELLWRIAFAKVIEVIKSQPNYHPRMLDNAHTEFELVEQIDTLLGSLEHSH